MQVACDVATANGPMWAMAESHLRFPQGVAMSVVRGGLCAGNDGNRLFLEGCSAAAGRIEYSMVPLHATAGPFRIHSHGNRCVTVEDQHDGYSYAVVRACNGSAREQWTMDRSGARWQFRNLGTGKCLNAQYGRADIGARLIAWPCTPQSDNARWSLIDRH